MTWLTACDKCSVVSQHQTFGVWGSISWEYIGVLQFSDVIQADAQADIVDDLRWGEQG